MEVCLLIQWILGLCDAGPGMRRPAGSDLQLRCDRHTVHFAGRMIQERIIGRQDPFLMVHMKTLCLLHLSLALSTASDIEDYLHARHSTRSYLRAHNLATVFQTLAAAMACY